ncbi:pilus assembly PilX N-terminal domain-containing protein [Geomonas nitrogeniifigens]|uniref:Pilus assembly PilX N-terminal domain-containing protein n=1 Tax=Geomonas diazotrophica TaxID=2843197 RepID=A0ABX8JH84_9BACT|nr:pilus assembly PilX N-terminal domain-containing protein [Geomonas nitrogeniifigens]QWV96042.1 pilus assembly PilX N-terminal domain-containing protein [Geomonas nitrogeniifigens]QXE85110.1 pilus assembly PilX N-terminal domain-containing protein [Geomonas nitrogeniifigens]
MKKIGNEDGIALVTALMFTLICLGIVAALMQMLLLETKVSGSQKNYRNALEASYGGTELVTREFIPKLFSNYSTGIGPLLTAYGSGGIGDIGLVVGSGLKTKLANATADWGSLSKTSNAKDVPDLQFTLRGLSANTNFKIYAKVVDTIPGNSDPTGVDYLDSGAGVAGVGSGIAPKHNPALYSIEVQGERASTPKEKALLSVLYAY